MVTKHNEIMFDDADQEKLDNIEAGADVTDSTNVAAAGAVMNAETSTTNMQFVVDEDDMSSDSPTKVPTQQSTKAYVDFATSDVMRYSPAINNDLLVANQNYLIDVSLQAVNVYLPVTPSLGDQVEIRQGTGDAEVNNILIHGNGNPIGDPNQEPFIIDVKFGNVNFVFTGTFWAWEIRGGSVV